MDAGLWWAQRRQYGCVRGFHVAITEHLPVTSDPRAHGLLQAAHEAGYRFPADFAGFAADIEVSANGDARRGHITLRSPRDLDLVLDADEATLDWVRHEIGSMAGHRWPTPYAESDGRWTLTLRATGNRHDLRRRVVGRPGQR
jgi:hypothetical protein